MVFEVGAVGSWFRTFRDVVRVEEVAGELVIGTTPEVELEPVDWVLGKHLCAAE